MSALVEQRVVVPPDRMAAIFQEFTVLQRQRALINEVVAANNLSDIHLVISRAEATR